MQFRGQKHRSKSILKGYKGLKVITAVPLHHSHYFTEELKALQLDKERRDVINATYFPVNMPQVEFLSIPLDDGYGMF